ncbi:hypothetical protein GC163_05460 [bacterium]|nr:hypothetical protein [bacterium]
MRWIICASYLVGSAHIAWAASAPTAYIFQVQGAVEVIDSAGKARRAATFGCVYEDEQVKLADASRISLRLCSDGHREQIESTGTWKLTTEGLTPREKVTVLATQADQARPLGTFMKSLPQPSEVGGRLGGVTVARAGETDGPKVSPLDFEIVLTTTPTLSWPERSGVARYRVYLNSEGKKLWSMTTPETKVMVPMGLLKPGTRCDWQVLDARPGTTGPIAKASFTVAFPSQHDQAELLQTLAEADAESRAFAAFTSESQQFYGQAIELYSQLAKESDDAAFHAALAELYAKSGRDAEAQAARKRAEAAGFVFTKPNQP